MLTRWIALPSRILSGAKRALEYGKLYETCWRLSRQVNRHSLSRPPINPVVVFQASSGVASFSLNRAFSLITAWILRLAGVPVVHFVCQRGMKRCVMGTDNNDLSLPPPCQRCLRFEHILHRGASIYGFSYHEEASLARALEGLSVPEMTTFSWPVPERWQCEQGASLPLGALTLPSMRWILRRHNLPDDESTRKLYRDYMLSAWNVGKEFVTIIEKIHPSTIVLFNGQFFPEALVAWIGRRRGLRVITHEVGLRPLSAFFTEGEATAYPIHIPPDFELSQEQEARLDAYLEQRFQGSFTMAGIRFWPEMQRLDETFLEKASHFKQIVPVFTNVIFDTSQPHSNTVFSDMFAWLDEVFEIIQRHPETLFVVRAHPDEERPNKESRESVAIWIAKRRADTLPNLLFVGSREYLSSYELIQRSKFVMVYNSTIGLEASILGAAVLCAGKARFTQYPTVFFPQTVEAFRQQAEEFLSAERVEAPPEHRQWARRFLYYQLFRVSLPFDLYLEAGLRPGTVRLRRFAWQALLASNSPTAQTLLDAILDHKPFTLHH